MKTKNLLLISVLITVVYIGYLKMVPLNVFDMTNLWASIKPLFLHFVALTGCFIFNVLAYRKAETKWVILTIIFGTVSALTYFPLSLVMLIPVGLSAYAFTKIRNA